MKILQLHTSYRERGGEDSVVAAEAELLRSAGHQVVQDIVANPTTVRASAAALARAPWNNAAARRVRTLAERERPEVAHVHNTWFADSPAVIEALSTAGVPVVATLHNYRLLCVNGVLFRDGSPCLDCVGSSPISGVVHRCYRGSAVLSSVAASTIAVHRFLRTWQERVAVLLVPTDFARDTFVRAGLPPRRLLVKSHFTEDPGPRRTPPSASSTVLFVGRLTEEKGVDVLLEAWERFAESSLELLVIGDGPLRGRLEADAGRRVRFLGRLSPMEVRRHMLDARVLVFPTVWLEPFGMVLIEAMACGLPVVASDIADAASILGAAADGLLIRPADAVALAGALHRLEDGETLDAAGAAGRARYEALFTPAAGLSALENAYRVAMA